jgi:hypothetical protein
LAFLAIGLSVSTAGIATAETLLSCTGTQVSDDDFDAVACEFQDNDQIWHDADGHSFCREETVTGCDFPTACMGRCGPGCGGAFGAGTYRLDCAEHDRCCRQHGNCFSPIASSCGDEWIDAADDFIFGPRDCLTCWPDAPTTSWSALFALAAAFLAAAALVIRKLGRSSTKQAV